MRIISGEFKGRRLKSPPRGEVRPIQDKIKGAIFNMLQGRIVGAKVLDLFAGSGSFGLEALSQGASHLTFVEGDWKLAQLLEQNLHLLDGKRRGVVLQDDVISVIENLARGKKMFDLIFSDPPYGRDLAKLSLLRVAEYGILTPSGIMIIEVGKKQDLPEGVRDLVLVERRLYGGTAVVFYRRS